MADPLRGAARRSLALGGFMGVGKSTVGPLVADALGRPFVDLDERVVGLAGCPLDQLFAEAGEPAFRQLEHQALAHAIMGPPQVIALGGGTLHQALNRPLLAAMNVLILSAPWALLAPRIAASARPLAPEAAQLFHDRLAAFNAAGPQVWVEGLDPDAVAQRVLDVVEAQGWNR